MRRSFSIALAIIATVNLYHAVPSYARSIALVDFALRAPAAEAVEMGWLGPAVSELLQAKLQLFGGARVLERQRVRALLREAKADADPSAGTPWTVIRSELQRKLR